MVVPICVNKADEMGLNEEGKIRSEPLYGACHDGRSFYTGRFLASAFGRLSGLMGE